jgi:hypothetical protein
MHYSPMRCAFEIDDEVRPSTVRTWLKIRRENRPSGPITLPDQRRSTNEDTVRGLYLGPDELPSSNKAV